jgi:nucleoside-diphosphate-sugar epimerase
MKRVLVTGATGFIGYFTLPLLLEKGYEVHAVSSQPVKKSEPGYFWHNTDLLDPKQASDLLARISPSHLLHLAWYTEPGKYWTSPKNIQWVQSSLSLLNSFQQNGGKRIVFAGTCAEYDWNYSLYSEYATPTNPSTLYGTSKHALQLILNAFSRDTGISSAWGRIFYVFGPRERPERLIPFIIKSLLKKEVAPCSKGDQIRDFLYVEDMASAFVSLLDSNVEGPINIGSGDPIPLAEIIRSIGNKLNGEDLIQLGKVPTARNDPPSIVADVNRLKKEVNWQPHHNLDQGLNKTIQWWTNHLRKTEPSE